MRSRHKRSTTDFGRLLRNGETRDIAGRRLNQERYRKHTNKESNKFLSFTVNRTEVVSLLMRRENMDVANSDMDTVKIIRMRYRQA